MCIPKIVDDTLLPHGKIQGALARVAWLGLVHDQLPRPIHLVQLGSGGANHLCRQSAVKNHKPVPPQHLPIRWRQ